MPEFCWHDHSRFREIIYLLFHGNRHRTRRLPSEDQRPRCETAAESAVKQPINKPENRKPITQEKAVPHGQLFLVVSIPRQDIFS